MVTRSEVVEEARSWVDTRYHHKGRLKKIGVDCAGLVIEVAHNLKLYKDVEIKNYSKMPNPIMMKNYLDLYLIRIEIADAREGDVLFMRFLGENPQHLAIISEYKEGEGIKKIIHAYAMVRFCSEHNYDESWQHRTVAAYRYRGIE